METLAPTLRAKDQEIQRLRADVAELVAVLRSYERWEADVIFDNAVWNYPGAIENGGLPLITQALWDHFVDEIQRERNDVLARHRA